MGKNIGLYFLGYFIVFPVIYMMSFFIWMFVIKNNDLWTVFSDSTSILGLYYFIISGIFVLHHKNKINKTQ